MTTPTEQQRAEFEAWLWLNFGSALKNPCAKFRNGTTYLYPEPNLAFKAWQAAQAPLLERLRVVGAALEIANIQLKLKPLAVDVADLELKANRYDWLRHGDNDEKVLQHGPIAMDYVYLPRNEKLDEMIDAAMQRERT